MNKKEYLRNLSCVFNQIDNLGIDEKVDLINDIKLLLKDKSPFKKEPVDCVIWVKNDILKANDYNPNSVAPTEMKLLETSIDRDGYTQPIVAWKVKDGFEVIDGFHRNRVGKESKKIRERVNGFLPITIINSERIDRCERISSTIRHNRARGKHKIDSMSEIVIELKNRNWKNARIAKELGMDEDEILRLCQITGLSGLFSDEEFSKSWDIENSEVDFIPIDDDDNFENVETCKVVNTNDENRIFHTFDKWECYKAGFYNTTKDGMTKKQCEQAYADFLSDLNEFEKALDYIINNWKHSCEHYLTNVCLNRIAWLGQASLCYARGIPAVFRSGFFLLSEKQQSDANNMALKYLNIWLKNHSMKEVDMMEATTDRQSVVY